MFGSLPQINVATLRDRMKKKPLIIDVSEENVFERMHVAHAINVPVKELLKHPQQHLTKEAYIICETGNKSKKAVSKLHKRYPVTWVQGGTLLYARRFSIIRQQKIKEKA
jgi:rhodanese-related sulfurtransferase